MKAHRMPLDIRIVDEAAMPPELDVEIRAFLCVCFPADASPFSQSRHWHGSAPAYSVVCRDGRPAIAGHVGVVLREIRVGADRCRIFGIQNMAVAPDRRGTGTGTVLMQAVLDEARRRGIGYGVLFCVSELERYYARTGWRRRDGDVHMDYAGGRDIPIPGKNICMVHERPGRAFPAGDIHLLGADW